MDDSHNIDEICDALTQWFVSQGLQPHEGVKVCINFIACMSVENATSGENLIHKLKLINKELVACMIKRDLGLAS